MPLCIQPLYLIFCLFPNFYLEQTNFLNANLPNIKKKRDLLAPVQGMYSVS